MFQWLYLLNYTSHNYLREVRSQVFKFCENMTVLDLSHNKIERISPVAFDETSYATELKLNDNLLTSMSQVVSSLALASFLTIHQKGVAIASHQNSWGPRVWGYLFFSFQFYQLNVCYVFEHLKCFLS